MQIYLFASCARANDTWKQCQWIMKTITCKLKSGRKITSFGGLILKSSLFSMFLKLAGYIYWQITSRLSNLLKNLSSGFWNNAKFVGMDQISYTNCNKSSWMRVNKIHLFRDRPEQFPSFLEGSFKWYQTTMRWSSVSKACHFLRILANFVDSMLFHCFYDP